MKRWILWGVITMVALVMSVRGQDKFSQTVRPEDFAAAGLAKLTPEERARLDVLIADFKGGATVSVDAMAAQLAVARRATEAAAAARSAAEERANKAERAVEEAKADATQTKKAEAGFFAKAKVMLMPGSEVEYLAVESRIKGKFDGWEGRTVLNLENGQRWQIANAENYYTPVIEGPKVVITPAAIGGFWMSFPELRKKVRVKPL